MKVVIENGIKVNVEDTGAYSYSLTQRELKRLCRTGTISTPKGK